MDISVSRKGLTRWLAVEPWRGTMEGLLDLVGRIFLGQIFIYSGIAKMLTYGATLLYMEAYGVDGSLLPLVIFTELLGGLSVMLGWRARWGAFVLALFSIVAAIYFHSDFGQRPQMMKNVAMAGGLLLLAARGAGPWSLDGRRQHR